MTHEPDRESIGVDVWLAGTIYVDAVDDAEAARLVAERYGQLSKLGEIEISEDFALTEDGADFLGACITVYGPCEAATLAPADPVRDAAPDMLAALRKALDDWPQFDAESALLAPGCIPDEFEPVNGGDLVEWFAQWRETAKAAIAKAEGRANG